MSRLRNRLFAALLFLPSLALAASAAKPGFEMVKVADGVYAAISVEHATPQVNGNSIIIINDADVVVVDANVTPSDARAVLAEIRKLTDKPVRYVINTHWHGDHNFGNMAYQDAFPQVEFITHANTRADMVTRGAENLKQKKEIFPTLAADYEKRLAAGKARDGKPLTDKQRADITELIAYFKSQGPELQPVHIVPATITLDKELTLYRGKRIIKLLYLGRGNTRGDVVTYLPQEKVLITGDLLVSPVPYAYGSYLGEWVEVLKKLRAFDADVIIPGHGPVQRDHKYLDLVQSLLESVLGQTREAVKKGLSLEDTRKAMDLESFRVQLAGDDAFRNHAWTDDFLEPAVERAYLEAKGELDKE
jgi:cyclase